MSDSRVHRFNVGDKVYLNPNSEWVGTEGNPMNVVGEIVDIEFTCSYMPITVQWSNGNVNLYGDVDLLSAVNIAPEEESTYTPEQLSEIEELRERVEYLESLCSDYAKIIEEKDAEILRLNNAASDFWCDYR